MAFNLITVDDKLINGNQHSTILRSSPLETGVYTAYGTVYTVTLAGGTTNTLNSSAGLLKLQGVVYENDANLPFIPNPSATIQQCRFIHTVNLSSKTVTQSVIYDLTTPLQNQDDLTSGGINAVRDVVVATFTLDGSGISNIKNVLPKINPIQVDGRRKVFFQTTLDENDKVDLVPIPENTVKVIWTVKGGVGASTLQQLRIQVKAIPGSTNVDTNSISTRFVPATAALSVDQQSMMCLNTINHNSSVIINGEVIHGDAISQTSRYNQFMTAYNNGDTNFSEQRTQITNGYTNYTGIWTEMAVTLQKEFGTSSGPFQWKNGSSIEYICLDENEIIIY